MTPACWRPHVLSMVYPAPIPTANPAGPVDEMGVTADSARELGEPDSDQMLSTSRGRTAGHGYRPDDDPGAGVLHSFHTRHGTRFALLTHSSGARRLLAYTSGSDEPTVDIELEPDEADQVAELMIRGRSVTGSLASNNASTS